MSAAPGKVMLGLPCGDGRIYSETMMSIFAILLASGGQVQPFWLNNNSNICNARNLIAHYFLHSTDCDTLFFWDNDIVASQADFAYMMEGEEQVVIAPYARKEFGREPVGFGMGFCRIHRSVFDSLNAWVSEDGEEVLGRYYQNDLPQPIATHFFYTGPSPEARWYGEDTGFWHFCARRNITQRLERRTQLGHLGVHKYGYPDQLAPHISLRSATAYPPEVAPAPVGEVEDWGSPESPDYDPRHDALDDAMEE